MAVGGHSGEWHAQEGHAEVIRIVRHHEPALGLAPGGMGVTASAISGGGQGSTVESDPSFRGDKPTRFLCR